MSDQLIKLVIAAALLLHGLGHGGAIVALIWIWRLPGTDTGGWLPARSWLFPSMSAPAATTLAVLFWIMNVSFKHMIHNCKDSMGNCYSSSVFPSPSCNSGVLGAKAKKKK